MATVDELYTQQKSYADTAVTSAQTFVNNLYAIAVAPDFFIADIPGLSYTSRFSAFGGSITRPTAPTILTPGGTMPVLAASSIPTISEEPVPEFTISPPAIVIPTPPSSALPSVPAQPTVLNVDIPPDPAPALPTAPSLGAITLPSAPSLGDLPAFDQVLPVDDLVIPSTSFSFAEQAYVSALKDAYTAKLINDIQNGGYGIEPADEAPLWERARRRAEEAARTEIDQIENSAAARGFEFAPGDILVATQRARRKAADLVAEANIEIAAKRADLYVANRQFVLSEARQHEAVLIQYHGSVMERALNVQKALLDFAVANFNLVLSRHKARLEAYNAFTQSFGERVRAVLSKLEAYRTEMEGKRIESDIQRAQVALYEAQLGAVRTIVDIFRVRMDGAKVRSGIERDKIDAYATTVRAYEAQVGAKVAEFGVFKSQIEGELAKVQVFEAQNRAYQSTLEGIKTKADIKLGVLNGAIQVARNNTDRYVAELRGFETQLQTQLATVDALLKKYQGEISMYNVDVGALRDAYDLNAKLASLEQNERLKTAELKQTQAQLQLQAYIQSRTLSIQASNAAITTFGQRVTQAIGAMNLVATKAE